MSRRQPGLRRRLAFETRRISAQHRQLDELFAGLGDTLRGADPDAARTALQHLDEALAAHFDLEEGTHFPAIHGIDPDSEARIDTLVREHEGFREQLSQLRALLDRDALEAALPELETLSVELARHEEAEEQLLARSAGPASPGPGGGADRSGQEREGA